MGIMKTCCPPGNPKNPCAGMPGKHANDWYCGDLDCSLKGNIYTCIIFGEVTDHSPSLDPCRVAVLWTIKNREKRGASGEFQITNHDQYNGYNNEAYQDCCSGCFRGTRTNVIWSRESRMRAAVVFKNSYKSTGPDPTNGAMHFFSPKTFVPKTKKEKRTKVPDWASSGQFKEVSVNGCPRRLYRFYRPV
jgi:hypothetical protein